MGFSDSIKRSLNDFDSPKKIFKQSNLIPLGLGSQSPVGRIIETGKNAKAVKDSLKPDQQPTIPYEDPTAAIAGARDKVRRMARKANGIDSTIRANVTQPYSAAPSALLGS